jgi:hypothetical protein
MPGGYRIQESEGKQKPEARSQNEEALNRNSLVFAILK